MGRREEAWDRLAREKQPWPGPGPAEHIADAALFLASEDLALHHPASPGGGRRPHRDGAGSLRARGGEPPAPEGGLNTGSTGLPGAVREVQSPLGGRADAVHTGDRVCRHALRAHGPRDPLRGPGHHPPPTSRSSTPRTGWWAPAVLCSSWPHRDPHRAPPTRRRRVAPPGGPSCWASASWATWPRSSTGSRSGRPRSFSGGISIRSCRCPDRRANGRAGSPSGVAAVVIDAFAVWVDPPRRGDLLGRGR